MTKTAALTLDTATQEQFIEMLRTLPLSPKKTNVIFAVQGIALPGYLKEEEEYPEGEERYINECGDYGVMPYSAIALRFYSHEFPPGSDRSYWSPRIDPLFELQPNNTRKKKDRTLQGMIVGGKIHRVTLQVEGTRSSAGFKSLQEGLLDQMIMGDYHLESAQLDLTQVEVGSHYTKRDESDARLLLARKSPAVQLIFGGSDHLREKLEPWFQQYLFK